MRRGTLDDRAVRLFIALAAFFCVNAALAEFIGVKIFALEDTLGIAPLNWNLFGQTGSMNFTAGTLLWPLVFILTDTINEFFGRRGVRFISWLAVARSATASCSPSPRSRWPRPGSGSPRRRARVCPTTRPRSPRCSDRACGPSPARWSRSWPAS